MRYEIEKSKDGQWFFHLLAKNGAIIMTSETYKRKASCVRMIKRIRAFGVPNFGIIKKIF